jgi:hypothetical protein
MMLRVIIIEIINPTQRSASHHPCSHPHSSHSMFQSHGNHNMDRPLAFSIQRSTQNMASSGVYFCPAAEHTTGAPTRYFSPTHGLGGGLPGV